ncbi:MAG: phosphoethanolamine--lipid A transferase [Gammaproteobacteria bacterium]|nr:phosphoethanolamine--lipid A transferase [Gammaproteobacteria bacterium]
MPTRLTPNRLIVVSALFIVLFANIAFFRNALDAFGAQPNGYLHVASLALLLVFLQILVIGLVGVGRALKPALVTLIMVAASAAYFMDTYNVIIDRDMLVNAGATNWAETRDLLTWRLFAYLVLGGLLPALLIAKVEVQRLPWRRAWPPRVALILVAIAGSTVLLLSSTAFYASFFREHKSLRYYTNPLTPLHAVARYLSRPVSAGDSPVEVIGADAKVETQDIERELVIMVVGETARADRFSLNGYARDTNPRLATEDVVSFTGMSACGTSTAISVPCMFAIAERSDFDDNKALATENALDVLTHAGVHVLWRDNNSSSKGVSTRIQTEDYRSAERNPLCDIECRDPGMLDGLQAYIDGQAQGDILIVLHAMGSHGPAYYKRYPDAFRKFTPTCESSQLDSCSREAISNTYDNTILYTDEFLAQVIELLRANDDRFETAMVYVSDHGESLGESGVYLHGLPYFVAPEAQTHVASVMWLGRNYAEVDNRTLRSVADRELSHDNVFHTLLGLFEIESSVYDADKDILALARAAAQP